VGAVGGGEDGEVDAELCGPAPQLAGGADHLDAGVALTRTARALDVGGDDGGEPQARGGGDERRVERLAGQAVADHGDAAGLHPALPTVNGTSTFSQRSTTASSSTTKSIASTISSPARGSTVTRSTSLPASWL